MHRTSRYLVPACLAAVVLTGCDKAKDETAASAAATPPAATTPAPAPAKAALTTDAQRQGYALGANIGLQFKQQQIEVDADALVAGLRDSYTGGSLTVAESEIPGLLEQLQQSHAQKAQAAQQAAALKNKTEADAFLAQNKSAEGVVTTESGLQYKIDHKGDGPVPKAEDTVKVHYRGTLRDGTEFDSSYARNNPATFGVSEVIPGWVEALKMMPVGSKWHLYVPSELAYGPGGGPPGSKIGPNAMLEFDVELLGIEPKTAQ